MRLERFQVACDRNPGCDRGASRGNRGIAEVPVFALALAENGSVSNLMRRGDSQHMLICDCRYWTGRGSRGRFDYGQTVFCFEIRADDSPGFCLRPQLATPTQKLAALGFRLQKLPLAMSRPLLDDKRKCLLDATMASLSDPGIHFPDRPSFSARSHLRGPDSEIDKKLIGAGLVDFFLQQHEPLLRVEKVGLWLAVYRHNMLIRPEGLTQALKEAESVKSLFSR